MIGEEEPIRKPSTGLDKQGQVRKLHNDLNHSLNLQSFAPQSVCDLSQDRHNKWWACEAHTHTHTHLPNPLIICSKYWQSGIQKSETTSADYTNWFIQSN